MIEEPSFPFFFRQTRGFGLCLSTRLVRRPALTLEIVPPIFGIRGLQRKRGLVPSFRVGHLPVGQTGLLRRVEDLFNTDGDHLVAQLDRGVLLLIEITSFLQDVEVGILVKFLSFEARDESLREVPDRNHGILSTFHKQGPKRRPEPFSESEGFRPWLCLVGRLCAALPNSLFRTRSGRGP